jgi:peptidoglycan glycosyltransferase
MMVAVVKRGTGTAAALPGVTVAGKTGTATNPHGRSHAWFVGFAPAEDPRFAAAVVIENVGYGGTYAAPVVRDALRVALARSRS